MSATRSIVAACSLGTILIGCADQDDSSQARADTTVPDTMAASASTNPPPPDDTTAPVPMSTTTISTTPTSTTDGSDTSQPDASTTTVVAAPGLALPTADSFAASLEVPTGAFVRAPGDLIVLRTDGDLEYRPNALSPGNQAPPIPLLDRADPRSASEEGPAPNLVADVAAFVDGSVVHADCCEPVSGNVFVVDAPGSEVGPVAVGRRVDRSPDGSRLATASSRQFGIFDVDSGVGNGLLLSSDLSTSGSFRIVDIEWADDDTLMTIVLEGAEHWVLPFDVSTLTESSVRRRLDVASPNGAARFVGRARDGQLVVATTADDGPWDLQYLDPTDLAEDPRLRQRFPSTVSSLEIDAGGLGQVWVDGTTLYHLGPGRIEARPIGIGILAAWFVE